MQEYHTIKVCLLTLLQKRKQSFDIKMQERNTFKNSFEMPKKVFIPNIRNKLYKQNNLKYFTII